MNRIADLRSPISTIEEADQTFRQYALAIKKIAVADARFERDHASRLMKHKADTQPLRAQAEELLGKIAHFIGAHGGLFKSPRTRKLDVCEYGLRTATELIIDNEDALLNLLMDRGYDDCMQTVRSVAKSNVRARLSAGEEIPHCHMNSGDTVVAKVSKALLNEARQDVSD